jgi:sterol desaturase/sphingolipid hydroxylase (fatty acid hydroxylase superfamily)
MMEALSLLREYLNIVISVLVLSLVFYLVELIFPAEKDQPTAKRLFNLAYMPFIVALILLLQPLFGLLYSGALRLTGGGLLPAFTNQQSGLAANLLFALLFALVWDVWQYWIHRLQHTIPVLWQTHKFHHTETALNSSTQARHHALNYFLLLATYVSVIVILGPQQPHFIATVVMFRLWGFVNHANIRFSFGPLTPFVAGPQWHRIHHSILDKHHNRNFATFFPFLDLLFGTYYAPQKGEYPATGLTQRQSGDLREATVAPLVAWYRMAFGQNQNRPQTPPVNPIVSAD